MLLLTSEIITMQSIHVLRSSTVLYMTLYYNLVHNLSTGVYDGGNDEVPSSVQLPLAGQEDRVLPGQHVEGTDGTTQVTADHHW